MARSLVQGRRRLVETDRAFVFLCSQPIQDLDEYLPVSLRVFLKKYGVMPAHVTLFHARQISLAEAGPARPLRGHRRSGRNIVSVTGTYGYMEQPDIRGALRDLQRRGEIDIPSERWIIEVGEEEIITGPDLPRLKWFRLAALPPDPPPVHAGAQVLRPRLRRRRVQGDDPGRRPARGHGGRPARAGDRRCRDDPTTRRYLIRRDSPAHDTRPLASHPVRADIPDREPLRFTAPPPPGTGGPRAPARSDGRPPGLVPRPPAPASDPPAGGDAPGRRRSNR